MHIHLFKRKSANALPTSTYSDNAPHVGTSSDVENRWRETLAALAGVDQRTREIYIACRAGYSYAEIAAYLGISQRKVKKCIARALLTIIDSQDPH
jgi:DNA-directed RNA polymerase specialized sigma24 family protein